MEKVELSRFVLAQENTYEQAFKEIRSGKKQTHWMWFIFPQLVGLGQSHYAQLYGIRGQAEAEAYLDHHILGKRLIEISDALLSLDTKDATRVMGKPDDMKLQSSMTLFLKTRNSNPVFRKVLDKFFQGERDEKTLQMLKET